MNIYKRIEHLGFVLFSTAALTGFTALAQSSSQQMNQPATQPSQTTTTTTQSQTTTTKQTPEGRTTTQTHKTVNNNNGNNNYASRSSSTVRNAQQALKDDSCYRGAVDGIDGPQTQAAIRKYQRNHKLAVNGRLDQETLNKLGVTKRSGSASRSQQ